MNSPTRDYRHKRGFMLIVEHLEPFLGRWVWLEYKHVSEMIGRPNLLFTNVRKRCDIEKLREVGQVSSKSIVYLENRLRGRTIVLDPQSPTELSPFDIATDTTIIVGGILGDHPPLGRTRSALTERMPKLLSRNLGPSQFTIDGAVYVALEIAAGKHVTDIPVRIGVEIEVSKRESTFLPFAYPLVNGRPVIAPGLRGYLRHGISKDEEVLMKTGKPSPSI